MPRTNRPMAVTLGDLQGRLRALDREEEAIDGWLRRRVEEAFANERLSLPANDVFRRFRKHHAAQVKARRNEKYKV